MTGSGHRIKVVFLISDLDAGGAERVMVTILRHIDRSRFEPILYLSEKTGPLLPLVPQDIKIFSISELKVPQIVGLTWITFIWRFTRHLKQIRADVIVSFLWHMNRVAIIAGKCPWMRVKTAVSERTSTSVYAGGFQNFLRSLVIRLLYPFADVVIAPSTDIAKDLVLRRNSCEKIRVIHNPVDLAMIRAYASEALDHPWYSGGEDIIIAIGRLGSEKGFPYLIRAMGLLREEGFSCKLLILGEGTERVHLEKLIAELDLTDNIELAGFQENPYKYLARSRVFVLSSLYEGFPNVLAEALALGIPSVATRCPSGPEEIITDEVDGILVKVADEKAIADAIKRILQDETLRKILSENAKKRAEDFAAEKIVHHYERVIEDLYICSINK